MFSWFKKKPPRKPEIAKPSDWEQNCPDCGVPRGSLHDLFCTKERCPFCDGQLITCDCLATVLQLSDEERKVVDDYVDDSIEPLKGIMERWRSALDNKGRVPFHAERLGVDVDSLILTAAKGELPFVRRLLGNGVSINARNEVGYTALMAAARNYRVETVAFLLQDGADVHNRDVYGHTALHCAAGTPTDHSLDAQNAQAECVRLLLERGADPNAKDEHGGTPIMGAAWFGCETSVEQLLCAGADPSAKDDKQRTAEQLARERGHTRIAAILAKHQR